MSHQNIQFGKINCHIIQQQRVAVFDAGSPESRGAGVHQGRDPQFLGLGVQRVHAGVVGVVVLVNRIDLDAAEAVLQDQLFQAGGQIAVDEWIEAGEGYQSARWSSGRIGQST